MATLHVVVLSYQMLVYLGKEGRHLVAVPACGSLSGIAVVEMFIVLHLLHGRDEVLPAITVEQ